MCLHTVESETWLHIYLIDWVILDMGMRCN